MLAYSIILESPIYKSCGPGPTQSPGNSQFNAKGRLAPSHCMRNPTNSADNTGKTRSLPTSTTITKKAMHTSKLSPGNLVKFKRLKMMPPNTTKMRHAMRTAVNPLGLAWAAKISQS